MADLNKGILRLKKLKEEWNNEKITSPVSDFSKGQSAEELRNAKNLFASIDKEMDVLLENTIVALTRMNETMDITDKKIEENIGSMK